MVPDLTFFIATIVADVVVRYFTHAKRELYGFGADAAVTPDNYLLGRTMLVFCCKPK